MKYEKQFTFILCFALVALALTSGQASAMDCTSLSGEYHLAVLSRIAASKPTPSDDYYLPQEQGGFNF